MQVNNSSGAKNVVVDAATALLFAAMRNVLTCRPLKQLACIHNGQGLRAEYRDAQGKEDVYASGGLVGKHPARLHPGPFAVIGRKGSAGKTTFAARGGW